MIYSSGIICEMMHFTESDFYLNKRIATSFLLGFALLLVMTLVNTVYDWMPDEATLAVFPVVHAPRVTYHLQDISSWHLLGANPNGGDLPETNLQLSLQGILTMTDPSRSTAIIAQPGKSGEVYQPGDLLPGGAILDKVMTDRVIIRNRGKLESLSLVRPKLQFAPIPSSMWS